MDSRSPARRCGRVGPVEVAQALGLLGPRAVVSHGAAAELHGLELVEPGPKVLTVPRARSRAALPGWRVRRCDLPAADVEEVSGLRCTTVARTLLDLAGVLPRDEAVAAADRAVRLGQVDAVELTARTRDRTGRGAAAPRAVVALLDPRAESLFESLVRVLLVTSGVPAPELQWEVRTEGGGCVARLDFAWVQQRLALEADGFAFHSDRAAYRRDRERLNQLELRGWRVLRVTWEDVRGRPEHVVALVRAGLALAA